MRPNLRRCYTRDDEMGRMTTLPADEDDLPDEIRRVLGDPTSPLSLAALAARALPLTWAKWWGIIIVSRRAAVPAGKPVETCKWSKHPVHSHETTAVTARFASCTSKCDLKLICVLIWTRHDSCKLPDVFS